MDKTPINIGILAHADAGKTSLTEQILFNAKATKQLGSVDKKSSHSDTLTVEKERGISVLNSSISFTYNNRSVNLIDTPGHIDFVSEVDKCFDVLDMAILVVSAVEGIQGQTIQIYNQLSDRKIPTILFINKIDRVGADVEAVFKDLKQELQANPYLINTSNYIESLEVNNLSYENLAEVNDDFMEAYLNETLPSTEEVKDMVLDAFKAHEIQPLFVGSAKLNEGIDDLMLYVDPIEINHQDTSSSETHFKVYKIEHDKKLGKLYHIKNLGQSIQPKTKVILENTSFTINQLFKPRGLKYETVDCIETNDIGILTLSEHLNLGAHIKANQLFYPENSSLANTCLVIELKAKQEKQYTELAEALTILDIEDPALNFIWDKTEKTFNINIQGEIQIEILTELIYQRFDIEVEFKDIQIQYKETPKQKSEGYIRYWMPKPCWAILTFEIEPGEPNSGVVFASEVGVNDVSQKYQNEIKRAIPWALEQGLYGWEVTDLKITLIKGEEHQVHSNPGDFLLATPMGILDGLKQSDTELLEPTYELSMKFNQDDLGKISTELNKMDAEIGIPEFIDQHIELKAIVPVAKALKFPIAFNSITSGKGRLTLKVNGYKKTAFSEDKVKPFKGVHPLDQAQWILHYRGAYKADERKR
jgi:ribosomal protection tetracycline resistance protein